MSEPDRNLARRHVPNAINIGLGGQFATWAGTLISTSAAVAIVAATQEQIDEAFMRLARVGIETVKGFMLMKDFSGKTNIIEQISVERAKEAAESGEAQFVDVRNRGGTRKRSREKYNQSAAQFLVKRTRPP